MIRAAGLDLAPDPMPATRGDCRDAPRPCMRLACRHHLALRICDDGRLALAGGGKLAAAPSDQELEEFAGAVLARIEELGSCVLDVVDENPDGLTLQRVAVLLGVTRERTRQLERRALIALRAKIRRRIGAGALVDSPAPSPRTPIESVE